MTAHWSAPALSWAFLAGAILAAVLSDRWREDRLRSLACARIAVWCVIACAGFHILSWGERPLPPQRERAARTPRTALADPRAPESLPATARDDDHGVDLLPRGAR